MKYVEEWNAVKAKFKDAWRLGLDPKDEGSRELYEHMIYWLAKIYMDANWGKIARSKTVYRDDVFEHVIKAASSQPNVRRVNDRICEDLGLQSIRMPSGIMDYLETHRRAVLRSIRLEPIYFCLKAGELAIFLWNEGKQQEKTEKTVEGDGKSNGTSTAIIEPPNDLQD